MIDRAPLKKISPCDFDVPAKKLTTFRSGGKIAVVAYPENEDQLLKIFRFADENGIETFSLGGGSNLLVSDSGFQGVAVKLSGELSKIEINGERMILGGGVSLIRASKAAMRAGLQGLEFACSIPGSVGGAVFMNAGAHGGNIAGIFESAKVLDQNMNLKTLHKNEVSWDYRRGIQDSRNIFTTIFKLNPFTVDKIRKMMDNNIAARKKAQPAGFSAGSVFRNPPGNPAWKLIREAGFAGEKIGGAIVSEMHCNFILNDGNATSSEIYALISKVSKGVEQRFGVKLQREIRLIGSFD